MGATGAAPAGRADQRRPGSRSILRLRDNFTAYDAAYVVLARALEAPLVTADAKLRDAEKVGVEVRVLGMEP